MRSEFTTTTTTTENSPLRWSPWSPCSATCDGGLQSRRSIEGETEQRKCNQEPCHQTWSSWSTCSATCGPGVQTRTNGKRRENRDCTSKQCPNSSEVCEVNGTVYGNQEDVPDHNPCALCICVGGDVLCAYEECSPPEGYEGCEPLPKAPEECCPSQYKCETTETPFRISPETHH